MNLIQNLKQYYSDSLYSDHCHGVIILGKQFEITQKLFVKILILIRQSFQKNYSLINLLFLVEKQKFL